MGGGRPSHVTYDHRVDVYSFGMLLWEAMHAQVPFAELSHVEVGRRVCRGERPPMGLHGDRVVFEPIVAACWSQAPSRRPAMTEVVQSLLKLEANMGEVSLAEIALHYACTSSTSDGTKTPSTAGPPSHS